MIGALPKGVSDMYLDRFEVAEVNFNKNIVVCFYPKGEGTMYDDVVVFESLDDIATIFLPPEAKYLLVKRP